MVVSCVNAKGVTLKKCELSPQPTLVKKERIIVNICPSGVTHPQSLSSGNKLRLGLIGLQAAPNMIISVHISQLGMGWPSGVESERTCSKIKKKTGSVSGQCTCFFFLIKTNGCTPLLYYNNNNENILNNQRFYEQDLSYLIIRVLYLPISILFI